MATLLNKKTFYIRIIREAGITLMLVLLSYFVIAALRDQIMQVNTTIYTTQETRALRDFYETTYTQMHAQMNDITDAKRSISAALPATEDIREFLDMLNTLGTKHAVAIQVGVGSAQPDAIAYESIALRTIVFTIDARGQIQNIRKFVTDIEKLPYFFTIMSIEERSLGTASSERALTIRSKLWTKPEQVLTRMQAK